MQREKTQPFWRCLYVFTDPLAAQQAQSPTDVANSYPLKSLSPPLSSPLVTPLFGTREGLKDLS